MAKKFNELRQKMSPERRERIEADANRMLAGLTAEVSHTITIPHTEGCLGAPEAEKLARSLAASRGDVTVEVVLVADEEHSVALGFRGSPTVLVDGVDVEPSPEVPPEWQPRQARLASSFETGLFIDLRVRNPKVSRSNSLSTRAQRARNRNWPKTVSCTHCRGGRPIQEAT